MSFGFQDILWIPIWVLFGMFISMTIHYYGMGHMTWLDSAQIAVDTIIDLIRGLIRR